MIMITVVKKKNFVFEVNSQFSKHTTPNTARLRKS